MTINNDLDLLANEILRLRKERIGLSNMISDLERDLALRMRLNHQTTHENDRLKIEMTQKKKGCPVTFLHEFGELDMIPKNVYDEIYSPKREVTVEKDATVNLTKLNKLKKFGGDVWEKADKCIIKDEWRINKIKEKKL